MKRKRLEAWAVVVDGRATKCSTMRAVVEDKAALERELGHTTSIVRLVEHDPSAAAVVRAAVACIKQEKRGDAKADWSRVYRAVERMRKGRRK